MIHLINLKSTLLFTICIAGTLLLASSCTDNQPTDSKDMAEQENISRMSNDDQTMVVVENDNDAQFLMDAAEIQLEGISLGQLAQKKGASADIKKLGKMMEDEHTKSFNELKALAQSKSVALPAAITDDSKDAYEDLNEESGNDFDQAYSDLAVDRHEDAIKLFEDAASDSEDPQVRTWASNSLSGLRTHLSHAEATKKKVDK